MRVALSILLCLFALGAEAATNIQQIQLFTGGTNGGLLSQSILDAGTRGVGTWDLVSGFGFTNRYWRTSTNLPPYKLPGWVTLDGTNYDAVSTNWVYYDLGSNAPVNDYEQFRFTVPGGSGGNKSNLVSEFYMLLDGLASSATDRPNLDIQTWAGNFGTAAYLQLAVRTNNTHQLYTHAVGTSDAFEVRTNIVYLVQTKYSALSGTFSAEIFNATNNFKAITNLSGTGQTISSISVGAATNAYEIRYGANYLNEGLNYKGSGRIWFSSPVHYFSSNATARAPDTNAIVSDRTIPWIAGSTVGVRGTRPIRTVETNGSFYNLDAASDDNTTNFNAAFTAAASNTVVLINGANGAFKIRSGVTMNGDGITLRGTNNAKILLGSGGSFTMGPTILSVNQGKQFAVTNGTAYKGSTNLTLTTNYSAEGSAGVIAARQIYQISQMNGDNPQERKINNSGAERAYTQDFMVLSTNGNTIVIWPPLVEDFTNAPMLLQKYTTARLAMALENVTITLTNSGVYETNNGTHTMLAQGMFDSWISGSKFLYGNQYQADLNNLVSSDVNSNEFRHPSPKAGEHAGVQMTGGSGNLIYDNIIEATDRGFQLFGGVTGNAFVGNFVTNGASQGVRYHAPGNGENIWERNYFAGSYIMGGDGYFGGNKRSTFYWNVTTFIVFKRFNPYHNIVRNVVDLLADQGFPNLGNLTTNGLSRYSGAIASQQLTSGPAWNFPQTNFTGSFGVSPYVGAAYTNIYFKFTDVTTQISQGTNILGDFSNWPYSAAGGYSIIFQDGVNTNKYWHYADFTNSILEQISTDLRAWIQPSNGVMVLNRYMPISNGWTMFISGPDTYQQRQTIDEESLMVENNTVTGSVVDNPVFLPQNYRSWLTYDSDPSWWSGAWPGTNAAKLRFEAGDGGGGSNPAGPGISASIGGGKVTIGGGKVTVQ